jgi:hypothetical protein
MERLLPSFQQDNRVESRPSELLPPGEGLQSLRILLLPLRYK